MRFIKFDELDARDDDERRRSDISFNGTVTSFARSSAATISSSSRSSLRQLRARFAPIIPPQRDVELPQL